MRHLFFVQSAHTEIIALSIIRLRDLNIENCRFVSLRNYQIQSKVESFLFPQSWRGNYFQNIRFSIFKNRWIDLISTVDELTSSADFCVYLPQFSETFVPMIITHPKCQYFCHIEEGLHSSIYGIDTSMRANIGSRFEETVKHFLTKMNLQRLNVDTKDLPAPCFTSSAANEYFHVSQGAFKEIGDKRRVNVSLIDGLYSLKDGFLPADNYIVIPIDSFDFVKHDEVTHYLNLVVTGVKYFGSWSDRTFILKAHPKTRNVEILSAAKKRLCDEFKVGYEDVIITTKPLELFFASNVSAWFIGGVSSTLVYAATCNKRVISFAKAIHGNKVFERLHHPKARDIENILVDSGVILLEN